MVREVYRKTRLLGLFAPIFYFNFEHVLIVNIEKQRKKYFADFIKIKFDKLTIDV